MMTLLIGETDLTDAVFEARRSCERDVRSKHVWNFFSAVAMLPSGSQSRLVFAAPVLDWQSTRQDECVRWQPRVCLQTSQN